MSVYRLTKAVSLSCFTTGSRRLLSTDEKHALTASIRTLMRNSAQPVAVITTLVPVPRQKQEHDSNESASTSHVYGATLSSFTTVSLNPPMVAFSIRTPSRLADALQSTKNIRSKVPHFIVNILSTKQDIEAGGFAQPGLEPFTIQSNWSTSSSFDSTSQGNEEKHPLSNVPFFPSKLATDDAGVSIPVLGNSIGSLACSFISKVSLKDLDGDVEGAEVKDQVDTDQEESELFLARVHGIEYAKEMETNSEERLPMVYWKKKFGSVVT